MSARRTRNCHHSGTTADRIIKAEEASTETTITGLRPTLSDTVLASSMQTAIRPVVSDSDRLAPAAVTWN
jgi:hypothetical protein